MSETGNFNQPNNDEQKNGPNMLKGALYIAVGIAALIAFKACGSGVDVTEQTNKNGREYKEQHSSAPASLIDLYEGGTVVLQ